MISQFVLIVGRWQLNDGNDSPVHRMEKRSILETIDSDNENISDMNNNQMNEENIITGDDTKKQVIMKTHAEATVDGDMNDGSFNNIDPFSLANGLSDSDQGLIDFANDDEVESIAAGQSDDQLVTTRTSSIDSSEVAPTEDTSATKSTTSNLQSSSSNQNHDDTLKKEKTEKQDADNQDEVTNQMIDVKNNQPNLDKLTDDESIRDGEESVEEATDKEIEDVDNLSDLNAMERSAMRQLKSTKHHMTSIQDDSDRLNLKYHSSRPFSRRISDTNEFKLNSRWQRETGKHLTRSVDASTESLSSQVKVDDDVLTSASQVARSDSLLNQMTPRDTSSYDNNVGDKMTRVKVTSVHSGHKKKRPSSRVETDERHGHHNGHHSSLFSSLPGPFVFSEMRPTMHQIHNKIHPAKRVKNHHSTHSKLNIMNQPEDSVDQNVNKFFVNHQMNHQLSIDEDNFNRLKRADSPMKSSSNENEEEQTTVKSSSNRKSKDKSSEKLHESSNSSNKTSKDTEGKKHVSNMTTPTPLINLVPAKKNLECEKPAYLEFPPDLFGQKLRSRGFVLVHLAVVCYMFYCLAVVCDNYFLPALEECAQVSMIQRKERERESSICDFIVRNWLVVSLFDHIITCTQCTLMNQCT